MRDLGLSEYGDWMLNRDFLIFLRNDTNIFREVPQRAGGTKYALDQMLNKRTVRIAPAGVFKEGIMVAWLIDTLGEDQVAIHIFDSIAKLIRKKFSKAEAFYIGGNAKRNLLNGWRLVTNDKSPKEYDLIID